MDTTPAEEAWQLFSVWGTRVLDETGVNPCLWLFNDGSGRVVEICAGVVAKEYFDFENLAELIEELKAL